MLVKTICMNTLNWLLVGCDAAAAVQLIQADLLQTCCDICVSLGVSGVTDKAQVTSESQTCRELHLTWLERKKKYRTGVLPNVWYTSQTTTCTRCCSATRSQANAAPVHYRQCSQYASLSLLCVQSIAATQGELCKDHSLGSEHFLPFLAYWKSFQSGGWQQDTIMAGSSIWQAKSSPVFFLPRQALHQSCWRGHPSFSQSSALQSPWNSFREAFSLCPSLLSPETIHSTAEKAKDTTSRTHGVLQLRTRKSWSTGVLNKDNPLQPWGLPMYCTCFVPLF